MPKTALATRIASLKDQYKTYMQEPVLANNTCAPLCFEEMVSLTAMISYVAHLTGRSEYRIERILSDRFSVPNPKCLTQSQYDDAIRFMADQVPLEAKNA
ncbi:MAG: hypothetical protein FWF24_04605 [Alphaproteobacteria bacterium]|nr:hypothetical protein [Alphaproteobacteria bacterium]